MELERKPDRTLDVRGQFCPQPVLMTKIEMDSIISGQILEVLATDPAADSDIKAWAKRTGNKYIASENIDDFWRIYVKKK